MRNFQKEVPALDKLKLVIELELRGRGDIQLFRVEVPGPKVTRDIASDAKVRLSVPRGDFNELARDGKLRQWREAFASGTVKASGPAEILKPDPERGREPGGTDPHAQAEAAMSVRMPAEWAPHERTIMCWPARAGMWGGHQAEAARTTSRRSRTRSRRSSPC